MGTVPPPTKLKKQCVNIISQNTRGLSEDKEEELINSWKKRNVFAGCLQETWRAGGLTQWENNGFVFIHNGLAEKPCSRGAQGVAVVLGPEARKAWEKAGCVRFDFGSRIVAVRLEIAQSDRKRRPVTIFLVSSYASDSSRPAEEHVEFEMQRQRLYDTVRQFEVMVEGTDTNASLGIRSWQAATENYADRDFVVGPFGIPYVNEAGKAVHQLLGMNQLCAATTYFQKTAGGNHAFAYTTWEHPARKSPFQLDHFFVKQKDLKLVRDAGTWNHGVDSDHRAIFLKLELDGTLIMPTVRMERVDRSLLQDPVTRAAWRSVVAENVGLFRGSFIDGVQATPLQVLERAMV